MRLVNECSNKSLILIFLLASTFMLGQEFNAVVQVNPQNVAQPDLPIFKTLETSLQEFINNTEWTNKKYEAEERIECTFVLVLDSYSNDRFSGNLQISAARPVFNSSYNTPIFNFKDQNISFEYLEYAPFFYNDNQYENNLISLVTFYVYTILGIDSDTFELNAGQPYHATAQRIVNLSSQNQFPGWKASDGTATRFQLNDDMLSQTFKEYRELLYTYHRKGMDVFSEDQKKAKTILSKEIVVLKELNNRRPNSLLQRLFFDAKADEISSIFSGGPAVDIRELKTVLQQLAPNHSSKWRKIRV